MNIKRHAFLCSKSSEPNFISSKDLPLADKIQITFRNWSLRDCIHNTQGSFHFAQCAYFLHDRAITTFLCQKQMNSKASFLVGLQAKLELLQCLKTAMKESMQSLKEPEQMELQNFKQIRTQLGTECRTHHVSSTLSRHFHSVTTKAEKKNA